MWFMTGNLKYDLALWITTGLALVICGLYLDKKGRKK